MGELLHAFFLIGYDQGGSIFKVSAIDALLKIILKGFAMQIMSSTNWNL